MCPGMGGGGQNSGALSTRTPPCWGSWNSAPGPKPAYQWPSSSRRASSARGPRLPVLTRWPLLPTLYSLWGCWQPLDWTRKLFSSCLHMLAEDLKHFLKISCLPLGPAGFLQFQKKADKECRSSGLKSTSLSLLPSLLPGPH